MTQSLVLSPQMQQSLALLQAPTLELKALVEQELHAAELEARRLSRAAAKERQARILSRERSGKSARSWSSFIPPARYSSTS